MRRFVVALLVTLLFGGAQAAETQSAAPHPALWTVQGKHCIVYLFGSVHALPPAVVWRDERIDAAIRAADTFYFETALDPDAIKRIVTAKGSLPPGQSLRAMLPPQSQKDLDDGLASLGVPEANLDMRRPWYATLAMVSLKVSKSSAAAPDSVDMDIMREARTLGKPLRYFETIEQQMALLAPDSPKVELESFEAFLRDFRTWDADMQPLLAAWMDGDRGRLAVLLMKDYAQHPLARKALFDDRNKVWLKTIENVLEHESGTFLVTVGAGHLLTERGVPAMLRRDGYSVEEL